MRIGGLICGRGVGNIVTDARVANAILRRAAKKNNLHPAFKMYLFQGHIECSAIGDTSSLSREERDRNLYYKDSFSNVEYKGKKYMSKYFDGCFKPFIVEQIPNIPAYRQ